MSEEFEDNKITGGRRELNGRKVAKTIYERIVELKETEIENTPVEELVSIFGVDKSSIKTHKKRGDLTKWLQLKLDMQKFKDMDSVYEKILVMEDRMFLSSAELMIAVSKKLKRDILKLEELEGRGRLSEKKEKELEILRKQATRLIRNASEHLKAIGTMRDKA